MARPVIHPRESLIEELPELGATPTDFRGRSMSRPIA